MSVLVRSRTIGLCSAICPLLILAVPIPAGAQRQAIPLNDHTRLGQRFTVNTPIMVVRVSVPSWMDNEGGLTLTLWDSPERKRRLGEQSFADIPDNATVDMVLRRRAPAGSYYWEVDRRTGTTRVGLYADPLPTESDDCAYIDGVPARTLRFVFSTVPSALPTPEIAALLHQLRTGEPQEKKDACRALAAFGDARTVPDLARLLRDPDLSHMARLALQSIPGPAAAAALRAALKNTSGLLRIGIINSIGERRDALAVRDLTSLLSAGDTATASAAAVALGKIGNAAAADALMRAMRIAGSAAPGIFEGVLTCADTLERAGEAKRAASLYDALVDSQAPEAIRMAAARGAVASRGAGGLDRLLQYLRSPDAGLYRVGLWALQRHVPGAAATKAVLDALDTIPNERRPTVVEGLGRRGDAAALPGLIKLTGAADMRVGVAAVGALARLGGSEALATLSRLLAMADGVLSSAAETALAALPREDVAATAASLMDGADAHGRSAAIGLVFRLRLSGFSARLLKALGDSDVAVRSAAVQALGTLGDADALPRLLDIVTDPRGEGEGEAAAAAFTALARRLDQSQNAADMVAARMASAAPPARTALIHVLGDLATPSALATILQALKDSDAGVRDEALNALCAWPSADAAPELLRLASEMTDNALRLRCVRGVLRIAGSADMPRAERLRLCRESAPHVTRDAERRMLLGVVGQAGLTDGLPLALPLLENAAVRQEVCAAILAIAEKVGLPLPSAVRSALENVVAASGDPATVRRARDLLAR